MTQRTLDDPNAASAPPLAEPVYTIDNPPPRLLAEEEVEATWQRLRASPDFSEERFGHCRPTFLAAAPIRLYGLKGGCCVYRDAQGKLRALHADEHDQAGIASLFAGAEGWLRRLWPAPGGGWDEERAAETLMYFSGCVGLCNTKALGLDVPDEQPW